MLILIILKVYHAFLDISYVSKNLKTSTS